MSHEWTNSTLGHGETMCSRCGITNREAAVLGEMDHCPKEMTSPPLDYRKEAADRLTRASNTFPAHIDRDGVGWIKVRQDDVFAILGEREALLADNARMVKALEEARKVITVVRQNIMVEVIGGNQRFEGVPEILAKDIANINQALSGANHAER